MSSLPKDEKPIVEFREREAWASWLRANHRTSSGVWLRFAKKASGLESVSYDEALDVALCYGWIDGQTRSDDAQHWLQKFTPRGKRSLWSKRNREKALALIKSGKMRAGGRAEIERAKSDGRWDAAYDSPRNMRVPEDFAAALSRNSAAQKFFAQLNSQNRYAILFRIETARQPATRTKRIRDLIEMLARNEKLYA